MPRGTGELYRSAIVVTSALLGASLIAGCLYQLELIADPIDVVGVPLVTGYSEAGEQTSSYAFLICALGLAAMAARPVRQISGRVVVPVGALCVLVLAILPALSAKPQTVSAFAVAGVVAYLAGAGWCARQSTTGRVSPVSVWVALAVWYLTIFGLPAGLTDKVWVLVGIGVAAAGLNWCYRRLPGPMRERLPDWRNLLASTIVLVATLGAPGAHLLCAGIGAAGFLFGAMAGSRSSPAIGLGSWLASVSVLVGGLYLGRGWWTQVWFSPALLVANGAAAAAVFAGTISDWLAATRPRVNLGLDARRTVLPIHLVAPLSLAAVSVVKPWLGFVVTLIAAPIYLIHPIRQRHWFLALLVAAGLLLAFVPGWRATGQLDPFHDGQILSAVWEFEQGRALFVEVFPLRLTDFWTAWLTRRLLGPAIAHYVLSQQLLTFLAVGGACLMGFAWTRSVVWAFATGVLVGVCPPQDPRVGLSLCLAAISLALLRGRMTRLAGLVPVGVAAGLLGYDVFVPFAAGVFLAVLAPAVASRASAAESITARLVRSLMLLGGIFVCTTALLALWQGPQSAQVYWSLLVDYSRNYPAFYGLPLPWDSPPYRCMLVAFLVVVATWTAVGVYRWGSMSEFERRAWCFLLVEYVLKAQRGIGRSDYAHLIGLLVPSLVLGSLGLYSTLRFLRRQGMRTKWTNRRRAAFAIAGVAVWLTPNGHNSPSSLLNAVRTAGNDAAWLAPYRSSVALHDVAENEFVWDMENGLIYFAYQRHNPTRHAISYCIGSPAEQRQALADLEKRPPKRIAWKYISGSDSIPNPLRYYIVSKHLYRRYRPARAGPFLAPAEPDWPGEIELSDPFNGPLPLGELAMRWGRDRIGRVQRELVESRALVEWQPNEPQTFSTCWQFAGEIQPRRWNYLVLNFACRSNDHEAEGKTQAVLLFAPRGRDYDRAAAVSWTVSADGKRHTYLLPIGCSPGWSWRPAMDRLQLCVSDEYRIGAPHAVLWDAEETKGRSRK